jgi:geranylgeranyl diphosphate synthase type II
MIRLKTSVLLACALKIGAWLGDAPRQDAELLYRFGENLGLAFQLQDDYLDVYGDPAVFGKKIGGDILCNKKTYMLIKALEHADKEQAAQLKHWITVTDFDPAEKIEAVTGLYNRIGVKLLCENKMSEYNNKALESLAAVNVTAERKRELDKLIKELMYREV